MIPIGTKAFSDVGCAEEEIEGHIVNEGCVLQVSVVVHGTTNIMADVDGRDPYEEPRKQNKFVQVR